MKDQLPLPGFRDEPQLYDTLETWEQFLADVKAMPESLERPQTILHAVCMISLKREELEAMPDNLPDVQGLIDPPGPFGNNLEKWEAFLTDMDEWPDCVLKRETINHAKQIIAMKKRLKQRVLLHSTFALSLATARPYHGSDVTLLHP